MGPRDPVGADPEDPFGARPRDPVGAKNSPASSVGAGVGHSESQHTKKRRGQGSKKKKKIGKQHCEIHTISQEMSKRDEFSSSQSSHQYR